MGFIPLSRLSEYLREYPEETKRFFIDPNNPEDDKYREAFANPNLAEECDDMEYRLMKASILISSVKNWVGLEAILKNPEKREIVKKVGDEG